MLALPFHVLLPKKLFVTDYLLLGLSYSSPWVGGIYFLWMERIARLSIPFEGIVVLLILAFTIAISFRQLYKVERRERLQLKALIEHANEGIFLIDSDDKILLANPSAEHMFGFSKGELLREKLSQLISKKSLEKDLFEIGKLLDRTGGRSTGHRVILRRKDGSEFHAEVSLSHFFDGSRRIVIAFILDTTDKMKSEALTQHTLKITSQYNQQLEMQVKQRTAEFEAANRELVKSQAVYYSMAHNFPDGFIGVMDRDLRYVLVDGKALPELGLDAQSILHDRLFDNIHSTITSYAEGALMKVFEGANVSFDVEIEGKFYNVSSVPIEEEAGEINRILVVVKNISAQKNLERELVKTLEKEKELNTLKSRFVTMASHEFRTPLTTILSSTFLLENYTGRQLETEKKKHIDRIRKSVHGLTELLNDFLSLGRLEEGIVRVALKPVNLRQFIEDIIQEISLLKKEDQKIDLHFQGGEAVVLTDRQLVHNILLNLLSNAIKYSPVASVIGLTVLETGKQIKLTVSDHGIGIPAEEHKFIFKRFFRANNTSDIQGTGLGLNIVRRYVKMLKGHIEFRSSLSEGTTFTVTLPINGVKEPAVIN